MALVVLKFGGTSLANPARIKRAAKRVRAHLRQGKRVVAVVSATGQTTDKILNWLDAVGAHNSREYDRALATGEDLSATLLASALAALDVRAQSLRGGEAGLRAAGAFGAGKLAHLDTTHINTLLDHGIVPVVSGFQAQRADGETVTLGRGGSDATAVFIAGVLNAEACHIITDVNAVCDVDPNTSPAAIPLPELTHDALVEITEAGGEVVQPAAARFAQAYHTKLFVYHYSAPNFSFQGTEVSGTRPLAKSPTRFVAQRAS
ncbi:MAG TPA: hypothetical protein VM100_11170 [Longimicrobiales bacterium]|nr:hypothetical protein [Longimicrobiales bacterium]